MFVVKERTLWWALIVLALLIQGCQGERERDIQGSSGIVIEFIAWIIPQQEKLSFPAGLGEKDVLGAFVFVDPFADPARGILLVRECGEGEEVREEHLLTILTPPISGVGTFEVGFRLNTDCDPGEYTASFFMEDEEDNVSNRIEFTYELT